MTDILTIFLCFNTEISMELLSQNMTIRAYEKSVVLQDASNRIRENTQLSAQFRYLCLANFNPNDLDQIKDQLSFTTEYLEQYLPQWT